MYLTISAALAESHQVSCHKYFSIVLVEEQVSRLRTLLFWSQNSMFSFHPFFLCSGIPTLLCQSHGNNYWTEWKT